MARKREAGPQQVRREGDPEGSPSVHFDAEKRCMYHLNAAGDPVYHGVPAGFEFNDEGALRPVKQEAQDG